jgi:Spy/CpxP family protein refolding chaperone
VHKAFAALFAFGAAIVLGVAAAAQAPAQPPIDRPGLRGQRQGLPPGGLADPEQVSPAEIQRMFDSYALMQAQEQLQIKDDQFPKFLTRFKALQDIRRQTLNQRARRVMALRQALNAPTFDEAAIREQLKGLQELEAKSEADIRQAYEAIDQILDLRQQAKFRVFEELMERRKLELVTRARQANRPKL